METKNRANSENWSDRHPVLAVLTVAVAVFVVCTAWNIGQAIKAHATSTTTIKHDAPDEGYDPGLLVRCQQGGGEALIPEGWRAGYVGASICSGGIYSVIVRPDEEWRCLRNGVWDPSWDATGEHVIPSTWNDGLGCQLWRD